MTEFALSRESEARRRRKAVMRLSLSLMVGAIIFVATNNSVAGAVLPSIHAAWASLCTGWWTLRSDHRRIHGIISAAFYVATACWHAAAAAFVSVLLSVALAILFGKEPTMDIFATTMLVLIAGLGSASLIGLLASLAAAILNIRVWVNPKLRGLVDGDFSRLSEPLTNPGFNHAVFVLATSVALPVLVACCYLLAVVVAGPVTLAALTIGPILAMVGYFTLASRIIAAHPAECWKP